MELSVPQRGGEMFCLRQTTSTLHLPTNVSQTISPDIFNSRLQTANCQRNNTPWNIIDPTISISPSNDNKLTHTNGPQESNVIGNFRGIAGKEGYYSHLYPRKFDDKSSNDSASSIFMGGKVSQCAVAPGRINTGLTLHDRKRAAINLSYGSLDRRFRSPYMFKTPLDSPESRLYKYNNNSSNDDGDNIASNVACIEQGSAIYCSSGLGNAVPANVVTLREADVSSNNLLLPGSSSVVVSSASYMRSRQDKYYGTIGGGCTRRPDESFV